MPEPDPPNPFAGGGEFPPDKVDPDWLYFLQHVRPDGHSYVLEVPARGASPPVSIKYEEPPVASSGGDAQSASGPSPAQAEARSDRRMEEEEEDSSADPPWYESDAGIDEDYRIFLRHMRVVNDRMVLEIGGRVVVYEEVARPGGSSVAGGEEKKDGEEDAAIAASREDGVGEKEEEEVISSDGPGVNISEPDVRDCRAPAQKVEEDQEESDEEKEVVVPASGKDGAGKDEGVGLDRPMAPVSEPDVCGWPADPVLGQKIKVVDEEEETPSVGTLKVVNEEANSSNAHDAQPPIAAGLHGVIWPTHIIERPESGFKQRLMHVLGKPFCQGEYDKLYGMATHRNMAMKERRTRSGVKYYYSRHEKSKSYYDCYPDLAKQVEGASYPNRLALLRGFFFWLENIGQEDQFRPWRDDHRHYKVIPLTGQDYPR